MSTTPREGTLDWLEKVANKVQDLEDRVQHLYDKQQEHSGPEITIDLQGAEKKIRAALGLQAPPEKFSNPEPKVVGYVNQGFLRPHMTIGSICKDYGINDVPVILQSDHEAVVRGLREEVATLKRTYNQLWEEADRLKAERDAYADPGNWTVESGGVDISGLVDKKIRPTYTGLTPSDTEEERHKQKRNLHALHYSKTVPFSASNTEAESVEGVIIRRFGEGWDSPHIEIRVPDRHLPFSVDDTVRITRIPTPGGEQ